MIITETWQPQTQMMQVYQLNEKYLAVSVAIGKNGDYLAFAIETAGDSVDTVLASHGHKALGAFDTLWDAMCKCEEFAIEWSHGREKTKIEGCECEEMGDGA